MPHAKSLTINIKVKRTPLIIERDYPKGIEQTCCFCEQRFLQKHTLWHKTWEHLDNNDENEALWNLSWSHWKCNQDKKFKTDLQIQAKDIIKRNKEWEANYDFESTRASERKNPIDEQTEIDLNMAHTEITEQFLTEKLPNTNNRHLFLDAISCIVLRCRTQTGHGSSQSVRNYLNVLSCSEGDYVIEKIEGKNFIRKSAKNGEI